MELNKKNLASYIAINNGTSTGISMEDLEVFFDEVSKKQLRQVGKCRQGILYPKMEVWDRAIKHIIYYKQQEFNKIINNKKITTNDCLNNVGFGKIRFKSYLTKRQIRKLVNEEMFEIEVNQDEISLNCVDISNTLQRAIEKKEELAYSLSTVSLNLEDTTKYLKTSNKTYGNLLIDLGYAKRIKVNTYELTNEILFEIFKDRLIGCQSSVTGKNIRYIEKKLKGIVVNTPMQKEALAGAREYLLEYYDILKEERLQNALGEEYTQFIITKKK